MPAPRVLVNETLASGARLRLDSDRARHLTTVLRLGAGASVRVFNASDGEWRARIEAADKRGVELLAETHLRAPRASPDLDLLFAPVKRHATDLIVEKATELGVRRIRPVITARTIAETVRLDRLAHIAREAAEQTERFDAPEILPPLPLSKALDGWDASRTLIYADESGDDESAAWGGERGRARPIGEALSPPPREGRGSGGGVKLDASESHERAANADSAEFPPTPCPLPSRGGGKLALLTGPEGGFDSAERRLLRSLPFVLPVSLGPRILRAETAAIAALSVIQSAWGDWRPQR